MTICERCGSARTGIAEECPSCHFRPESRRDLAIAALLTTQFEAGDVMWGAPEPALEAIARDIRAGKKFVVDQATLRDHERAVEDFLAVAPRHVVWGVVRLFLPAIWLLAGLLAVWLILRALVR